MSLAPALADLADPFTAVAGRFDPDSPVAAQDREREAALSDVRKFARHVHIQDVAGNDVAFAQVGWAWQFMLLWLWAATKLSVVLKARQLGVSWLAAMYALWVAIRKPGQVVLLISRRQDDADKLLEKVAYIYERLPAWKPRATPNIRTIRFSNGSSIEAMPATENVGRSRTANLVVLDEHAHQPFARKILQAVLPAATSGQILSISSGNGKGALHSQLFLEAKGGTPLAPTQLADGTPLPLRVTRDPRPDAWRGMFLPYTAHPGHDEGWRRNERLKLSSLSDAEFTQEHPRDDVEAITETGHPVFGRDLLDAQVIRPGLSILGIAGAVEYEAPREGERYVIGADPAEGQSDSDWSSASVLRVWAEVDGYHGEQVAAMRDRWAPEVFAAKLDRLARYYARHANPKLRQPVLLAWERNNHGHAVRVAFETTLYKRHEPYAIFTNKSGVGWLQTAETRAVLVDELAGGMREAAIALHDETTVEQFSTFHENDKGKAEAQEGSFDDDVIAVGLAWQMRRKIFGQILDINRPATKAA